MAGTVPERRRLCYPTSHEAAGHPLRRGCVGRWKNVATTSRIVLLNCQANARKARLEGRGHADLANAQMDSWSAYLFGQAEALMLPILDTSDLGIDAVVAFLERQVESLRSTR
jgi:hypothetical protein